MRRKINNFVSVAYSLLRMVLYKIVLGKSFEVCLIERISPNVVLEFNRGSHVWLGKRVRIHSGSKVKVRSNAILRIGDDVKINYYCIIAAHHMIEIGKGTEFGPSVYLYDHDHDYKRGLCPNSSNESYNTEPIKIGENCWIGADTVILRGTELGDNCVVGAGCVLKGKYPANSVVIQKKDSIIKQYEVNS